MVMDSIFSGFAGAALTAIVALVTPYLARNYAVKIINETVPKASLPPFAAFIVKKFGAMEISEAKRFVVELDGTYSDPHGDFSVSIGCTRKSDKIFSGTNIYISLVLPGALEQEIIENPKVGWTRIIEYASIRYRLTMVSVDNLTFELRELHTDLANDTA